MADQVDDSSANIFNVNDEQCQEDSFVEDKVCISETVITVDNVELQGPIGYDQIKQNEESTWTDNIKTEMASFEVTEEQNDEVKVEEGISADNIKIKFDNGLLYCEHCEEYYIDYCIECGMLVNILNKNTLNSADKDARADIPNDILEIQDCSGQTGIFALRIIPAGVKFGPFTGFCASECPWEMKNEKFVLDKNKSKYLNWMQYINPTMNTSEGNLRVFQCEDNMYYQSTRQMQAGDELLVYFGEEYGTSQNKIVREDSVTIMKNVVKDIFACTFCCLGFSSKSLLAKHKTVCTEDLSEKFSIEELTQCSFCKIHLDQKEYYEHHMTFCCERNARKGILSIPPAEQATTALSGRKTCLRQIYKCEKCKYRTKYQAELKEHIKQHYNIKIYKCEICSRRFKTKEILRLHVENTHAYVGKKNDQEHSTTDYRNTLMKVEQSNSQDQKRKFKCSLCVFRAKDKRALKAHIKNKHLKEFNYECDSCEYGTDRKSHLGIHIKTKHLKKSDYKCDSCDYGTNIKRDLEVHIKSKHLKMFDYKCDSCEYGTNNKTHLKTHIKRKHLKQFNHKCDSCDYETSTKYDLEKHIKTKHLKEFDYECEFCEYETSDKYHLEKHIKTKHLKEFDYECEFCEYETNNKCRLERHIKTKHMRKFDYKCDSCEYRTNAKCSLTLHIKSRHLKTLDYKCDSCEYGTNNKCQLERHIKSKHLKQFDYKCDYCKYRTNYKNNFADHMKRKHL